VRNRTNPVRFGIWIKEFSLFRLPEIHFSSLSANKEARMSKKLLLADDSVTIQKVVGLVFANEEYDLQCVSNGDAAFEKISFERPDIVLADVNMPGKNGFELCSAIKNNPASSEVPVLLLVGVFESFDEEQARSAGADGWIVKPFESQDLIDEVEGLLSRAAETASRPEPEGAADAAEPDVRTDMELDDLDMDISGDAVALDEAFSGELAAEEFELEEESLWEGDQTAAEEPQPVAASSAVEEVHAEEEDIFFIDEDDLLDEEPEQIAVSTFTEQAEQETSAPEFEAPAAEFEAPAAEFEVPAAEFEVPAAEPDAPITQPDVFAIEADSPAEGSLASEAPMETPPESADGYTPGDVQPAAETPSQSVPEKAGLDFWRNESLITRLAGATVPEPQAAPETSPPAGEPFEAVASNVAEEVAPDEQETAELHEEEVAARVQALSEEELGRIVERVAGAVIERLAGSILEKIAWEVVPDLAEGLIKEEIRKITETSH
jgi:DNA-binding response OmpR family regulator